MISVGINASYLPQKVPGPELNTAYPWKPSGKKEKEYTNWVTFTLKAFEAKGLLPKLRI